MISARPHVLIVGAGVTGLVIAHGLEAAGIPFTIFESEEEGRWRSKEWTMGIHWGLPLLESLLPPDLASRIDADGSVDPSLDWKRPPNTGAVIWDAKTGELLKDLTPDGRMVRVSRQKLRKLCQEKLPIHWGHTMDKLTCSNDNTTVTASFTNGKSYDGSILVGADGPRSAVRDFLFREDPSKGKARRFEDVVVHSMVVSFDAETAKTARSAHPVTSLSISPDVFIFQSVQDIPHPENPETWKFCIFPSWFGKTDDSLDNAGRMRVLKERGKDLAEPFRTTIASIPEDTQIPYVDLAHWIAQPWDTNNGLVTMAGDAAHPMPPYRGQGGNHALQDAYNFVQVMKKIVNERTEDRSRLQAQLIQEYSDEVAQRGAEETQLSIKNGYMAMSYYEFKESPYMKVGLTRGKS